MISSAEYDELKETVHSVSKGIEDLRAELDLLKSSKSQGVSTEASSTVTQQVMPNPENIQRESVKIAKLMTDKCCNAILEHVSDNGTTEQDVKDVELISEITVRPTPEPSHKRASPEYSQETKHSKKRRRSTSRASSPIDEYQKVSKNVEKKEKSRQPKDETAVKKKKEKKDKESSKQEYAKKVAEETKKRERRSPTPAANFDLEADALRKPSDFIKTSVRQCEECNVSCSLFHDLISHYVEKHGAKIGRVCLFLFCDTTLLARKVSPPGRNCPRCELKFESDVQYFVHLLSDHVLDICYQLKGDAFASFDNVDTEVSLKMPNKPDLAFSFNIVLPRGKQMFLPKIYNNRPSY